MVEHQSLARHQTQLLPVASWSPAASRLQCSVGSVECRKQKWVEGSSGKRICYGAAELGLAHAGAHGYSYQAVTVVSLPICHLPQPSDNRPTPVPAFWVYLLMCFDVIRSQSLKMTMLACLQTTGLYYSWDTHSSPIAQVGSLLEEEAGCELTPNLQACCWAALEVPAGLITCILGTVWSLSQGEEGVE